MSIGEYRWKEVRMDKAAGAARVNRNVRETTNIHLGTEDLIFLVHGFNVNPQEAEASYEKIFDGLPAGFRKRIQGRICRIYWPGYENILPGVPGIGEAANAASYPRQIKTAKLSARLFGDFLIRLYSESPTRQFIFVAHSLGCRLVLETLKYISEEKDVPEFAARIEKSLLMAAAVPVKFVKSDDAKLGKVVKHCKPSVLYSPRDFVLRFAFPVGQLVEGFHEAVGLHGNPRHESGSENNFWIDYRDTLLGHSDYWESDKVANYLTTMLGGSAAKPLYTNTIHKRTLPTYSVKKKKNWAWVIL
jgi:hypothetical protein